jgi:ribonuclease-3
MTPDGLQQRLGYRFKTPALLVQALTHRSFGQPNNERLEFLGDSILNCVIASLLYRAFGTIDEGDLSRVRATLVRQQTLYEIAQRLGLGADLRLGEGELRSGGGQRPSILADGLEALFGAIYLDAGFEAAAATISALYAPILKNIDPDALGKDAKTRLQEHLQGCRMALPVYSVVATRGGAHEQTFEVACVVAPLNIRTLGEGSSRRIAEQAAARLALDEALALARQNPAMPRTHSQTA